jgi:hypothetical protein
MPPSFSDYLTVLGGLLSWSPRGLSRPVQGWLYMLPLFSFPNLPAKSVTNYEKTQDGHVLSRNGRLHNTTLNIVTATESQPITSLPSLAIYYKIKYYNVCMNCL